MKRYRRKLKQGLKIKLDVDAWKVGLEEDIAFLSEHDPKGLNFALNHTPPGDNRRNWIKFCAKLGRLRQRSESDDAAKAEYARVVAAVLTALQKND